MKFNLNISSSLCNEIFSLPSLYLPRTTGNSDPIADTTTISPIKFRQCFRLRLRLRFRLWLWLRVWTCFSLRLGLSLERWSCESVGAAIADADASDGLITLERLILCRGQRDSDNLACASQKPSFYTQNVSLPALIRGSATSIDYIVFSMCWTRRNSWMYWNYKELRD